MKKVNKYAWFTSLNLGSIEVVKNIHTIEGGLFSSKKEIVFELYYRIGDYTYNIIDEYRNAERHAISWGNGFSLEVYFRYYSQLDFLKSLCTIQHKLLNNTPLAGGEEILLGTFKNCNCK